MELLRKDASYFSRELLRYPEVLESRFSVWQSLQTLNEPAPLGILLHAHGLQIQQQHMAGVSLRAHGGGQIPYIAKAVERLMAVESLGIRHGDLKTEHILLRPDGSVRWLDWDLAIFSDSAERGEWAIGTPEFMAPEKILTGATTVASEIYSIGKILFEQQEYKTNKDLRNFTDRCLTREANLRPQSFSEVFLRIKTFF
jgi:serine/threonine protein kinase